jgi:tRNA(Ile2) C34 agmatinyltransferase TiaS
MQPVTHRSVTERQETQLAPQISTLLDMAETDGLDVKKFRQELGFICALASLAVSLRDGVERTCVAI